MDQSSRRSWICVAMKKMNHELYTSRMLICGVLLEGGGEENESQHATPATSSKQIKVFRVLCGRGGVLS